MLNDLFDISRTISSKAVVYPGDAPLELKEFCTIGPGCPCNITSLGNWSTHFLTHVDPPLHFVENGKSLDDIPLNRFVGVARVVEVLGASVQLSDIERAEAKKGMTLLFRTRNSQRGTEEPFDEQHVFVAAEAAAEAARLGLNMIGIDYLSVDRFGDEDYPAHRTLLSGNVLILEGLDLSRVPPGDYRYSALPLKIQRGDGSPVRAILHK